MATESLLRGADFLAKVGLCSSGCLTKEKTKSFDIESFLALSLAELAEYAESYFLS